MSARYYVYSYTDPRNGEVFYIGKGCGGRKDAHLFDTGKSIKAQRIAAIKASGAQPQVRVLVRELTEQEAFLVEATYMQVHANTLTNAVRGHYSYNFRPADTDHAPLAGFDWASDIVYYNVGEGLHRNWVDMETHGFIEGGQSKRIRQAMERFRKGDVLFAYMRGIGYVGIGVVTEEAQPINKVLIGGKPLLELVTAPDARDSIDNPDEVEQVCRVEWIKTRPSQAAVKKSGLFSSQLAHASMANQQHTIEYVSEAFGLDVMDYIS